MSPKVLIIDDSPSIIAMLTKMLVEVGTQIIGTALTAKEGLELTKTLKPDIITLDIEMPDKSGLQILPELQRESDAAIIMCSAYTNKAALETLQSLEKGAFDYIPKMELNTSFTKEMMQERIENAYSYVLQKRSETSQDQPAQSTKPLPSLHCKLLVIGVSTGGPAALQKLFSSLPHLKIPTVVVQHMPALFVNSLASRLATQTNHKTSVATQGHVLSPGEVCFAPGDKHVLIHKQGHKLVCDLSEEPKNILHTPSVDILFQTAAEAVGRGLLAVVLTGMGRDGTQGGKTVQQRGGLVIAETKYSCIVYGMPKSVIEAKIASYEFELKDMAKAIEKLIC